MGGKLLRWPDGRVYLRRWFLTPNSWPLRLYLHRIFLPDWARAPHDHPSWFLTLVWGGYDEELFDEHGAYIGTRRVRGPALVWRPAKTVHRIIRVLPGTWSLSLWGPRTRSWGFWPRPGVFVAEALYDRANG